MKTITEMVALRDDIINDFEPPPTSVDYSAAVTAAERLAKALANVLPWVQASGDFPGEDELAQVEAASATAIALLDELCPNWRDWQ